MKTVVKLILTSIVSTFAFIGAMGAVNPWPAFAVAFGAWILFAWSLSPAPKKKQREREREELLEEVMRSWEKTRRG